MHSWIFVCLAFFIGVVGKDDTISPITVNPLSANNEPKLRTAREVSANGESSSFEDADEVIRRRPLRGEEVYNYTKYIFLILIEKI